MTITINQEKIPFIEICPTFEDFQKYIQDRIRLTFKWSNIDVREKMFQVYNKWVFDVGHIKNDGFRKFFYDYYGLKDRQPYTTTSLKERGFSDEDIDLLLKERSEKIQKQRFSKWNNESNSKLYHFRGFTFTLEEPPTCKICGSQLYCTLSRKGGYNIVKCTNDNCDTHKNRGLPNKAFLPEDCLEQIRYRNKENSCWCKEHYYKRGITDDDEIEKLISQKQHENWTHLDTTKLQPINKAWFQEKYGTEETIKKLRERSCWCIEFYLKRGYTEEEGFSMIRDVQMRNNKRLCDAKKVNSGKYRKSNPRCIEYWLNLGYNENEAKEHISEYQRTFSLEKCINKFGEEEGRNIWKQRQEKWQKTLHDNGNLKLGYSKVSQELFDILKEKSPNQNDLKYATHNKELVLRVGKQNYLYDFCDTKKRKIIEFQGDIFHGNPQLFNENDNPNPFMDISCKELWERDSKKAQIAQERGFDVLTIWEKNYRDNPKNEINKCLKFLNINEII